ncbi:DUF1491 family protein [Pseudoxanthobacter sp.]|uniref:DUF1491 family protein n=1 Tax=Pseudoxanthobacter sp. TaxID=1925742 RepID=UPI002FE056F4
MARVVSSFFVGALVRRCETEGAFAAIARRGSPEAGAIFVKVLRPGRLADLYAPAPQVLFDDERPADRLFEKVMDGAAEADVEARLRRETDFDPDLWIVEIEDRQGRGFVETIPVPPPGAEIFR